MQIVRVRIGIRKMFFDFILNLGRAMPQKLVRERSRAQNLFGLAFSGLPVRHAACEKLVISALIACRERRSLLDGGPPTHRNVRLSATFGGKFSQKQSISKRAIGYLPDVVVRICRVVWTTAVEPRHHGQAERDRGREKENGFHFLSPQRSFG